MAVYHKVKSKKMFIGKLKHGADLLEELTDICEKENIRLGTVKALGAVQKVRLAYYDQNNHRYNYFDIDKHLEITNLTGNISLKDDKPIVHAHIALADSEGSSYGGHLVQGTIVFACEFAITICEGPDYNRSYDEETGLPLWEN